MKFGEFLQSVSDIIERTKLDMTRGDLTVDDDLPIEHAMIEDLGELCHEAREDEV